jgi:hypothetical protein
MARMSGKRNKPGMWAFFDYEVRAPIKGTPNIFLKNFNSSCDLISLQYTSFINA